MIHLFGRELPIIKVMQLLNYTDSETPYTRKEYKHVEFGTQPDPVMSREYPKEWNNGDESYYPKMIPVV